MHSQMSTLCLSVFRHCAQHICTDGDLFDKHQVTTACCESQKVISTLRFYQLCFIIHVCLCKPVDERWFREEEAAYTSNYHK